MNHSGALITIDYELNYLSIGGALQRLECVAADMEEAFINIEELVEQQA